MRSQKGIVFKVKRRTCIVATPDREFHEVPLPDRVPLVGEEIDIDTRARRSSRFFGLRYIAAAVLVLALLAAPFATPYLQGVFGPAQASAEPVAYLAMDVNPSLRLGLDEHGLVETVEGLNKDAAGILEGLLLEGKPAEDAIQLITEELAKADYFAEGDDNLMLITISVVDEDAAEGLAVDSIYSAVVDTLDDPDVVVRIRVTAGEDHEAALGLGMSENRTELLGRINEVRAAADLENLDPEVAAKLPLKDLLLMLGEEGLNEYFADILHPGLHLGWFKNLDKLAEKQALRQERFVERLEKQAEVGNNPPAVGPDGTPPGHDGDKTTGKPDTPPGQTKDK